MLKYFFILYFFIFFTNLNANNNIPNTSILYQDIENIIIEQLELNKYKIALMNGKAEDLRMSAPSDGDDSALNELHIRRAPVPKKSG